MMKFLEPSGSDTGDKRKRATTEDPNVRLRNLLATQGSKTPHPPFVAQVQFYARNIQSRPQGAFIDVIHATWDGEWEQLERFHGYIQWLFPVFENAGMNWESSPLTKEGARQIRTSDDMSRRVLASYRSMLRFYILTMPHPSPRRPLTE